MKILLILLSLGWASCYTQKTSLSNLEFDKKIATNTISLFNELRYDVSGVSKRNKERFLLLFKNDTLKYIASCDKNRNTCKKVYKVDLLSKGLNILSHSSDGRYFVTDTVYVFPERWIKKIDFFGFSGPNNSDTIRLWTDIIQYVFRDSEIIASNKRVEGADLPITDIPKLYDPLKESLNLQFDSQYLFFSFSDRELAMYEFFSPRRL